jgi:copper chaperone NosL
MLVSSEIGSAQIVARGEDTRFYDDVGCLADDWNGRGPDATAFVEIDGGGWREAPLAFYGRPGGVRTAMGSGIVAYGSAAEARATDREGRALTWDEVVAGAGGHE